jgi:hypothetical protein
LLLVGFVVIFIDDVHDASLVIRGIHPPPPLAFDAGEDPLEQHAITVDEEVWEETEVEREEQEDPDHMYHSVGLVQDINPPEDVKDAAALARAAEARSFMGEIILLVTDRSTVSLLGDA